MTPKPQRGTPDGDATLAIQKLARETGADVQELQILYVLEALLARIAASPHRDDFVLKGGVLLAASPHAALPKTSISKPPGYLMMPTTWPGGSVRLQPSHCRTGWPSTQTASPHLPFGTAMLMSTLACACDSSVTSVVLG